MHISKIPNLGTIIEKIMANTGLQLVASLDLFFFAALIVTPVDFNGLFVAAANLPIIF